MDQRQALRIVIERDQALAEVERLRALMTPPVDPLQVDALGQAHLLIASLTEKVERLRGERTKVKELCDWYIERSFGATLVPASAILTALGEG